MKQPFFEQKFASEWQQFEQRLLRLEGAVVDKNKAVDESSFPRDYRRLCQLLSIARERQYSSPLVDRLNALVLRGHQQLYQRKNNLLARLIAFVVVDFPQIVRQEWRLCLAASALFYVPALLFFFFVWQFPELIYSVISPEQVDDIESMYDPAAEHFARSREAGSDWAMFGFYIQNNISISFRTFAGGIIFGLGSIFFLFYNGSLFGGLSAHIVNIDFHSTFFTFVIGHGAFELTAIVLSGAAGLKLGLALISPGRRTRTQALKEAARIAVMIMYGVILMLLIAAFIEAFWSSSRMVPSWGKYLVGASLWAFVISYFVAMGRGRESR